MREYTSCKVQKLTGGMNQLIIGVVENKRDQGEEVESFQKSILEICNANRFVSQVVENTDAYVHPFLNDLGWLKVRIYFCCYFSW